MAAEGVQAVLVYDEEEWDDATARFLAVPRVGELIVWGTAPLKVTAVSWFGDNNYPEKACVPRLHVRLAAPEELPRQRRSKRSR
jgi:hypothetical protein